MTYRILIKEPAKKQIDRLDKSIRERMYEAIKRIASFPSIGKPLRRPLDGYWSFRMGDWRIIYEIHEKIITIIVVAVGHRREIYEAIRKIFDRIR